MEACMDIKLVDNKGENTLANLLLKEIRSGAKVAIASAYFSLYAYDALSKVLDKVESFNFIYTKPTFTKEEKDLKRQYHLNNNSQSTDYPTFDGNKYEIQLSNRMMSPIIAKKLTEWIHEKACFKTITGDTKFPKQLLVQNQKHGDVHLQSEIEFTADGLGLTVSNREASYPLITDADVLVMQSMREFEQLWQDEKKAKDITNEVLEQVGLIYKENSPQWLYYVTLYNIFSNQLEELDADKIIKEGTNFKNSVIWNKLYPFQKDGVVGMIDKIEKYNGCILADSVGLGKTFSALAVIKYYELRNDRVLVLAPKKLRDNWTVYTQNDKRNILSDDRFNYDILNHTDLSREQGMSGEVRLDTLNWGNYDLIVIDESHNFRNNNPHKNRKTRYQRLMEDVIQSGVKTKVLMLSATPVNNKMNDIKNQIAFITEDNDEALETHGISSVDQTLRLAQQSYNKWTELPAEQRTTNKFLEMVNPEYFQILDLLTIARSRKHIERYYNIDDIGKFPTRLKPISIKTKIDTDNQFLEMNEVNGILSNLTFSVYKPMSYILPSRRKYYEDLYDTQVKGGAQTFKQVDRESAIVALMKVNIFKRLESSINSFNLTISRLIEKQEKIVRTLQSNLGSLQNEFDELEDFDDDQLDMITVGTDNVQIKIKDIDHVKWLGDLEYDLTVLTDLYHRSVQVDVKRDAKMEKLKEQIEHKLTHPLNPGNKKIIIFSAFADTIEYLYRNIAPELKKHGINSAMVSGGTGNNKTTMKGTRANDYNEILINFSPVSKDREKIFPQLKEEIDILFATDVISEGQNLQDCDYLINYDIHWNPVRVIQRFGRIDRIGSTNDKIQLVNFWPNMELDEYINLEDRVRGRMVILNTSATGEENILDSSGKGMNDLEYRRNQLKALQDEVVNLEDVSGGISITDLTFTEFKTDLSAALKEYGEELEKSPKGMYALAKDSELGEISSGVIFCFKQQKDFEVDNNNSLSPYFLLYINNYGEAKLHYTSSKKILDVYRKVSLGNDTPYGDLVDIFNQETDDGQDMEIYTNLLKQAMDIVMNVQEESFFDSFFTPGGTVSQQTLHLGTDDLELISFLIIKGD